MTITVFASPPLPPAARGEHFGAALRPEIEATWDAYASLFAAHGLDERLVHDVGVRTLDLVADWAPGLAAEIAGIACGAALDLWRVAALNARSEVLAHVRHPLPGECSTAVHLPGDGPPRTIQTWDWCERMDGVKVVWQYPNDAGRTVKTFTEYGVLGKIGVNSAGLGLHFNLLQHDADRAAALREHREEGSALCCHPTEDAPLQDRWRTLLTIALDVERGTLTYHDGSPCTATPQTWARL
ncbi:C45 family autoproteolytic acyltransferase/hydrolase [Actinocorallia sp. API 0066]|uniref:C45 family autoproteolytic acyltransferase/hydolase n=1 Tax=Actinocorallia sp. API 0066 TaxID=2896846 RepID=UPI001E4088D7|nr:C45 family peptidase [Actinocorallia sp. API 0066]MCD0449140.1 C45 family autoproteolytic acyltransferase/hydrolase [Actinocorallia sp. API 0066]